MIKKIMLLLVLFASFSFAAWQETAALAIFTSLMFIILVYVIGSGFGIEILRVSAKDEIYQVMVLVLMIAVLFGSNGIINSISTVPELAGEQANMQTTALLSLNNSIKNLSDAFTNVKNIDKDAGIAAAQGTSCNMMGMGYSVSGCGGFSMLASPFSLAGSIMGFAIGELNAVYKLIDLALNYALPLLLPIGIILRTFRFARGAGGLLIAIGIAMHLLLPMGILFVDMLGDSFLESDQAAGYSTQVSSLSSISVSCRAGDTGDKNSEEAINAYNSMRTDLKSFMFLILIKATLGPIVAVMMMVAGIRFISALAGAEIDVSALARVI